MNTLHLASTSPTDNTALADCLAVAVSGDALLLLQDGVYAAFNQAPAATLLHEARNQGVALYALIADIDARGLTGHLSPDLRLVDDNGFVELTERFARAISWF